MAPAEANINRRVKDMEKNVISLPDGRERVSVEGHPGSFVPSGGGRIRAYFGDWFSSHLVMYGGADGGRGGYSSRR